jgi:SSS family transporter
MSASAHFHLLDWVVLIGYLVVVLLIGGIFAPRQTSTREFFKAGKRMTWWAVGISVAGSLTSGIGFLGHPARVFQYDAALAARIFSVMLVTPIIMYLLLPFYCKLDVTTAYEYLERRFGLNVRLLASSLFILKRLFWMSLVALAPSLVLSTMTDIPVEYCILIIGISTTIYTGLGGLAAVIWTDVLQLSILVIGQITMIATIALKVDGGLGGIWRVGFANHKAWSSMDWNLAELTFWTMLISGLSLSLSDNGADQITVQALMSTKDEKSGRKSLLFNAFAKTPVTLLLIGMGVALWVFYHQFPDQLGLGPKEYDKVVPYFVITQLPTGLSGLVVAAIFAASMNGFNSGLNSLVAALTVDWYERLIRPGQGDERYLSVAKVLNYSLGFTITLLALVIYWGGVDSIIDSSNMYLGFFGGPLLGLFLLGVITRRCKALPTVLGTVASVAATIGLSLWQSKTKHTLVHPYMYSLIGCLLTMALGYLGSLVGPELPYEKIAGFTTAKRPGAVGPGPGPSPVDDPTEEPTPVPVRRTSR